MQVELTVVSVEMDVEIQKQAGGSYKGARLTYRDASGAIKEKAFTQQALKYNPQVKTTLSNLAAGDKAIMEMEKNGDFWNVKTLTKDGSVSSVATNSTPASGGNKASPTASPKSTYETPEERAKKQVYIVRQSSITAALTYLGDTKKMSINDVIAVAKQFEAYVFGADFDDGTLMTIKGDEDEIL